MPGASRARRRSSARLSVCHSEGGYPAARWHLRHLRHLRRPRPAARGRRGTSARPVGAAAIALPVVDTDSRNLTPGHCSRLDANGTAVREAPPVRHHLHQRTAHHAKPRDLHDYAHPGDVEEREPPPVPGYLRRADMRTPNDERIVEKHRIGERVGQPQRQLPRVGVEAEQVSRRSRWPLLGKRGSAITANRAACRQCNMRRQWERDGMA